MASDQAHSQCEPFGVTFVGAKAKPMSLAILEVLGSLSRPAATVASTHMARLALAIGRSRTP